MKILIINAGSSSLKYQLIDMDTEETLANATRVNDAIGNVEQQAENLKQIADKLTQTIGRITL